MTDEFRVQSRMFLETAPLYTDLVIRLASPLPIGFSYFPPKIGRHCDDCDRSTTWELKRAGSQATTAWTRAGHVLEYVCSDCTRESISFWVACRPTEVQPSPHGGGAVEVSSAWVLRKIGQSQLPTPRIDRRVERLLGDEAAYYRKALACFAEGFGLGALAYFRRIIENRTAQLLERIAVAADRDGDAELARRLREAEASHAASERLKLAAEALPAWLRPGGANPLGILYGAYSEELHAGASDADALERASRLQTAFESVIRTVAEHIAEGDRLRGALQCELEAKARKSTGGGADS